MAYQRKNYRQRQWYGIMGAKGHGKDTFANLVNEISKQKDVVNRQRFQIEHFADDLKRMASRIFGLGEEYFFNPSLKEKELSSPIALDNFVSVMNRETGLTIGTKGLVAHTPREIMQLFGTEYVRDVCDEYWIDRLNAKIAGRRCVLVPDARLPSECDFIRRNGGKIIKIVRIDKQEIIDFHETESFIDKINPDLVLGIRTGQNDLPRAVASLITMGRFKDALVYDYRNIKQAIVSYSSGMSASRATMLLGNSPKSPEVLYPILQYYGIPLRKVRQKTPHKTANGVEHKWCSSCSKWVPIADFNISRENWDGMNGHCRLCSSVRHRQRASRSLERNPLLYIFNGIKKSSRQRRISFAITFDEIKRRFDFQEQRCFYTGMPMTFTPNDPNKVSIDRLDSSKGYEPNNIVLCSKRINAMKNDMSVEEFLGVVSAISGWTEARKSFERQA